MTQISTLISVVLIGCGATVVMDLWLILLKRAGVQTQSFSMIGRWVGHIAQGRLRHDAIAKAAPVRGENALGWVTHYTIGVIFAGLLVAIAGAGWITEPSLKPAILFGVVSVVAPLLILQPAMGAGVMARKTARPFLSCARSVLNHTVFGFGLYLAATVVAALTA